MIWHISVTTYGSYSQSPYLLAQKVCNSQMCNIDFNGPATDFHQSVWMQANFCSFHRFMVSFLLPGGAIPYTYLVI